MTPWAVASVYYNRAALINTFVSKTKRNSGLFEELFQYLCGETPVVGPFTEVGHQAL